MQKTVAAGQSVFATPANHGSMYQHGFADLVGHQWEMLYMDESKLPQV